MKLNSINSLLIFFVLFSAPICAEPVKTRSYDSRFISESVDVDGNIDANIENVFILHKQSSTDNYLFIPTNSLGGLLNFQATLIKSDGRTTPLNIKKIENNQRFLGFKIAVNQNVDEFDSIRFIMSRRYEKRENGKISIERPSPDIIRKSTYEISFPEEKKLIIKNDGFKQISDLTEKTLER